MSVLSERRNCRIQDTFIVCWDGLMGSRTHHPGNVADGRGLFT